MELQQIRFVIAVAQYRSFTKAASALAISASTLSEQVRRLEDELSVEIFSRTTRRVELTLAGHVFVSHASQIVTGLNALREAVRHQQTAPKGVIALGIPHGASPPQFWRVLADFAKQYTGIRIKLTEAVTPSLITALHAGLLDISILSWPSSTAPSDLTLVEIGRNRTGLAISRDKRISARRTVALRELKHTPLITFVEGFAMREVAVDVCRRAGFDPAIAFESSSTEATVELVGSGVGFSILPFNMKAHSNVVYLECEPSPMDRILGIGWPIDRQLTPTAALLRDRIAGACAGIAVW
jgi:LysR family hydrogen peroxide-inducible transcriptional activator